VTRIEGFDARPRPPAALGTTAGRPRARPRRSRRHPRPSHARIPPRRRPAGRRQAALVEDEHLVPRIARGLNRSHPRRRVISPAAGAAQAPLTKRPCLVRCGPEVVSHDLRDRVGRKPGHSNARRDACRRDRLFRARGRRRWASRQAGLCVGGAAYSRRAHCTRRIEKWRRSGSEPVGATVLPWSGRTIGRLDGSGQSYRFPLRAPGGLPSSADETRFLNDTRDVLQRTPEVLRARSSWACPKPGPPRPM
jgi:hypothetical protein